MTDFGTALSAAAQRLVEAETQALLRQVEIEVARKHADIEWRAEYEPIIRKVGNETARWTVAEVAKWLLTEDEVGERLADALRERHAVADPLASEIAATVRSVLSALVAEINIVDGPGEDSDAGPLVP
ncbi:hypothetical protein [Arthrobacter sp. B3I4]|uniref:hypothetical protein n=1 Tax=Arthrobacter sp. B3I4 TaxID=3042267 RepID=UPI0027850A87|nr:hypothetical protein [Arthrobacter sp. B3I4]MDQ0755617.1 hypothetical protein [Arthrobacter sp. B3I4]